MSFHEILTKNLVEIRFKMPVWLIIILILLPLTAYVDVVLLHQTNLKNYILIGGVESFLIYLGFTIRDNTRVRP
jgi:hypothetical protein